MYPLVQHNELFPGCTLPTTYYRMGDNNGGTGTTVTDEGSGGNNATLENGPTFETDVPS